MMQLRRLGDTEFSYDKEQDDDKTRLSQAFIPAQPKLERESESERDMNHVAALPNERYQNPHALCCRSLTVWLSRLLQLHLFFALPSGFTNQV